MAFALLLSFMGLCAAHAGSPVAKVVSLLEEMETSIVQESEAEDAKIAKFSNMCERRSADLQYQIKTAKTEIEELSARISKADSKMEAMTTSIQETQESIAKDEEELKSATEVRTKETGDFKTAQQELLDVSATLERAMSVFEKEETSGKSLQVKNAPSLLEAIQLMMDASMIGHQDANKLTALLQDQEEKPEPAAYKSKSGGITEMLEDMMDKSRDELNELRKKETEAKHSFEMLTQSLQDQISFSQQALEKSQKVQAEQSRIKAEASKELEETKVSLAQDEKTLADFKLDCKSEVADYEEGAKSRGLELEALKSAKATLKESSGLSFLQEKSSVRHSQGSKHVEVVRMVRSLGQQLQDHQLVLLSRRMDSMLREGQSADIFAKIKTMITDMITTMQENLQAEATKKAYCDAEMGKANDKKEAKEADLESVASKIDAAASKSATLKKQVQSISSELSVLAETQTNMTKLRQEAKALFEKNEPETVKGMEGVKTALRTLREFYKSSGVQVTSGERKGAAGGVIGRLEEVEADMAMSLTQMRSAEKTAASNFDKDMQDMKLEKVQKEKDISFKTSEVMRLDGELAELSNDQESHQTEMSALQDFIKGLEAECLVTPESFAEKQAKKQQEIDGLKDALEALQETPAALIQRRSRALRGQKSLTTE